MKRGKSKMNSINKYVNNIIRKLDLTYKGKIEFKAELIDHITSLKADYISNGIEESIALEKALKTFDKNIISNYHENKIDLSILLRIFASIFLIGILYLFGLLFMNNGRLMYEDTFLNFVPFNFPYLFISSTKPTQYTATLESIVLFRLMTLLLYFFIGILVPIIINKINSCIPTLKFSAFFIILFELIIDIHVNIDFVVFPLFFVFLGYWFLKLILNLTCKYFKIINL